MSTSASNSSSSLVISPESTERLRQILRTEKLTTEAQLISLVKDALSMQYLRGLNAGTGTPTRDPMTTPSRFSRSDGWDQHRRAQSLGRIKGVLATVVVVFLAASGIIALNALMPELSASNPNVVRTSN